MTNFITQVQYILSFSFISCITLNILINFVECFSHEQYRRKIFSNVNSDQVDIIESYIINNIMVYFVFFGILVFLLCYILTSMDNFDIEKYRKQAIHHQLAMMLIFLFIISSLYIFTHIQAHSSITISEFQQYGTQIYKEGYMTLSDNEIAIIQQQNQCCGRMVYNEIIYLNITTMKEITHIENILNIPSDQYLVQSTAILDKCLPRRFFINVATNYGCVPKLVNTFVNAHHIISYSTLFFIYGLEIIYSIVILVYLLAIKNFVNLNTIKDIKSD